jgi:hypothetical protein
MVALMVLFLFELKVAKLSIWSYPYTENHYAKNVTTGWYGDECLTGDLIATV